MKVIRKTTKEGEFFLKALKELRGVQGKVGWFQSSKYQDGTSVAYVASIQEFGYPEKGIPARSFMRPTIRERQAFWKKVMEAEARKILAGRSTAKQSMEILAAIAAGDFRKAIIQLRTPKLNDATVRARKARYARKGVSKKNAKAVAKIKGPPILGVEKPLIDQGYMVSTLTHLVTEK